ncbi:MAG: Omp28-related outer membrane protein [Bacteroidetes bacterium]|nr:Omp28-related outer membrane protein [Bacteroidota bacterium]
MLIVHYISAQTLVSTDPQPKNVILEEYTGIYCGYCPDGHAIGQALMAQNPNRVAIISLHQGSYAVPQQGDPDFRTSWGDSLAWQAGVHGYPMATVNRHVFNGTNTAMSRGDWIVSAHKIMEEVSPVNVGVQSFFDSIKRELHIVVELYYTASSPHPTNRLNIALLQNQLLGPQIGGTGGNDYVHMHVLRDLITGQWGELITETTQGTFVRKEYTYEVPIHISEIPVVVENCEVAVFVAESRQEIYSGAVIKAINGSNMFIGDVHLVDTVQVKKGMPDTITGFTMLTNSALTGTETFEIILEAIQMPEDWEAVFKYNGQTYTDTAMVMLEPHENHQVRFEIIPGATPGMVSFFIKMRSVSYPEAPERYKKFYVISNVTDLIVNGAGGPESGYYDYVFSDGLASAGCTTQSTIPADLFVQGTNDRAFDDVRNIYLNIAWTFPSLTIDQIQSVKTFMNNGGNLLISGQDIGWDFMSGAVNSHGSPEATDFYQNYLFSDYLNDGNSTNHILYANTSDEVYSKVPNAFLVDIYDGNTYPDNIAARDGADEVFYYESNDIAAVVKAETNTFKMIYFACGLEMIGQVPVTNQILRQTYYWFDNMLSTEEYEDALSDLFLGQNMPNPANEKTAIPVSLKGHGVLKVFDSHGNEIISVPVSKSETEIVLDVTPFLPGVYFYKIITEGKSSELRKFIVY